MRTPLMADPDGIDVTGLAHLADPNWGDLSDRKCIAAALVNVVYLLQSNQGQAKQWCALLHFEVKEDEIMRDENGKSIFGVIFRWIGRRKVSESVTAHAHEPPSEVVSFRGTILKPETMVEDLHHNFNVALARMDLLRRRGIALEYLQKSIQRHGPHNIWIVGHSLGASIALAATRKLEIKEREKLEAHLFNPPFISPRLPELKFFEMIGKFLFNVRNGSLPFSLPLLEEIYKGIQGASEIAAWKMGLQDEHKLEELYHEFIGLGNWIPNLYVNEKDPICSTYIKYLEAWEVIYSNKIHSIYEAMKHLFCFEVANKRTPWHMVPSATLVVAVTHKDHHSLRHWWSKDLEIQSIHEYIAPTKVTQWNANAMKRILP